MKVSPCIKHMANEKATPAGIRGTLTYLAARALTPPSGAASASVGQAIVWSYIGGVERSYYRDLAPSRGAQGAP
jgi:hypothetical protein